MHNIKLDTYIYSDDKAVKISNQVFQQLLIDLQKQSKLEISDEGLLNLANKYQIADAQLKSILIDKLDIVRPLSAKKFKNIYINMDDPALALMLYNSLSNQYNVHIVAEFYMDFPGESLVIFYRKNYSNYDFKRLYHHLSDDVYVITAGIIHKILLIDNIYFNNSGLPTHVSNLHQLMAFLNSELPATKDNWLLFYRSMLKNKVDQFPDPKINACQQGFVAYAMYQFIAQYTQFFRSPTLLDQINWFWHVDLTSFNVHKEVAMHSAFSDYDMKLNLANIELTELA